MRQNLSVARQGATLVIQEMKSGSSQQWVLAESADHGWQLVAHTSHEGTVSTRYGMHCEFPDTPEMNKIVDELCGVEV